MINTTKMAVQKLMILRLLSLKADRSPKFLFGSSLSIPIYPNYISIDMKGITVVSIVGILITSVVVDNCKKVSVICFIVVNVETQRSDVDKDLNYCGHSLLKKGK